MVKNLKRTLALMLSIIMIFSSTLTAFADDEKVIASSEAETSAQIEETVAAEEETPTKAPKVEAATEEETVEAATEAKKEEAPKAEMSESDKYTVRSAAAPAVELNDVAVYLGEDAAFAIKTDGQVRSCQWQMSKDGGSKWSSLSKKTYGSADVLVIKATEKYNGRLFRCEVTFTNGRKSVSNAARLTAEEKPSYPEASFDSEKVDGVTVHVEAPEGALPAGTTMDVAKVNLDAVQDVVDITKGVEGKVVAAVDITFKDANGKEIEPNAPIKVEMTSKEIARVVEPSVIHVDAKADEIAEADVEAEEVEATVADDGVTFNSDKFSVYAVIEPSDGEYARATVNFIGKNGEILATYYVKNSDQLNNIDTNEDGVINDEDKQTDVSYIEDIVTDPGVKNLLPNELFHGWTTVENYTTTTPIENINSIRQYLADLEITEGMVVNIYAMIFHFYNVSYYGEAENVSLGTSTVLLPLSETEASYKINMGYTPSSGDKNFEGWLVREGGENIEGYTEGKSYKNETVITISGDIVFEVDAPQGKWLIFHENGGTYVAPQFVKTGLNPNEPTITIQKKGYTFDGWYEAADYDEDGNPIKDEDGNYVLEDTSYNFNQPVDHKTDVFAKWNTNTTAPYTVIFWTQNADRTGYDVAGSYVNNNGTVGQNIPYTIVPNGDETYVTGAGDGGHYTGFSLNQSKTEDQIVTPEGDAVLNLYYDRIQYELRFYLYRVNRGTNQVATGPNNNGTNTWGMVGNTYNGTPTTDYELYHETVDGYDSYYFTISAYYGDDISELWPSYDMIDGPGRYQIVSYILMQGAKLRPAGISSSSGKGTVKGVITRMDDMLLGQTNDADGNFLICRFDTRVYYWTYHIYYETIPGVSYTDTISLNGKTYYLDHDDPSRSSNNDGAQQNGALYAGYEPVMQDDGETTYYDNVQGTNTDYPSLNYYYNRLTYKITYMDGNYVSGRDAQLDNKANELIYESEDIPQGATISDDYINYTPAEKDGYVFEGWYLDGACTTLYTWTTMPVGGIQVHAKWRQIEYRVFLHPNAYLEDGSKDDTLNWGSTTQQMNFRIAYDGEVSTPRGTRKEYEFVDWYLDENFTELFNEDAYKLNDTTVPAEPVYDKTKDFTDTMDIWGEGATTNADVDRAWITRKLDLYGKWRAILTGAEGISVVYDAAAGGGAPVDNLKYLDTSGAIVQAAPTTIPSGKKFLYWVVQKWNETKGEYEDTAEYKSPGDTYTVLKANAKEEDLNPGDEGYVEGIVYKKYTIQLRAEYGDIETPTPTFIHWYKNDNETSDPIHADTNLKINEAVKIYTLEEGASVPTRTGYTFLGWARMNEKDGNGANIPYYPDITEDDLFLKYDAATNSYQAKNASDEWVNVTEVAADERLPYHALYAVWEAQYFYIYHSGTAGGNVEKLQVQENFKPYEKADDKLLYGGYYRFGKHKDGDEIKYEFKSPAGEGVAPITGDDGTAAYDGTNWEWYTPETSPTITPEEGETIYLKEVPTSYLLPYEVDTFNKVTNQLFGIYLLSAADDEKYSEVGFYAAGKNNKASLNTTVTIKKGVNSEPEMSEDVVLTIDKISGGNTSGKILLADDVYLELVSGVNYTGIAGGLGLKTIRPYWKTPDGVTVMGSKQRAVTVKDVDGDGVVKVQQTPPEVKYVDAKVAIKKEYK